MRVFLTIWGISLLLLVPLVSSAEVPKIDKSLIRKQRKQIRKQRRQQRRIRRLQKFLRSKRGKRLQKRIERRVNRKRVVRKQGVSIKIGLVGLLLILGTIVWLVNGSLLLIWIALGIIGFFLLLGLIALIIGISTT